MSNNRTPVTVIILTYNESLNLPQALHNVTGWAEDVLVLDSLSVDDTVQIAESYQAKVFYRKFDNYRNQREYALRDLPVNTEWVMFLDADEFLTSDLKKEIQELLLNNPNKDGYYLKRRFYFWGKWIRYGGYYPSWLLRLFRKDKASVNREINEHIEVEGDRGKLKNDFVDYNHKSLGDWIKKHNTYTYFEAKALLESKGKKDQLARLTGSAVERKRWIRQHIWNPFMPPLIRPFIYFFYRYFILLGFLDGKTGFIYHFLQGLWFPFLTDAKYMEWKIKQKREVQ
jgi:glycosyltransferase involved in cell wall biosynthesis